MRKLFTALCLICVLILFILLDTFLKVKTVDINPDSICLNQTVLENNLKLKNTNIIFLNTNNLEQKLQSKLPCLAEIHIKKSLPQKLLISTKLTLPIARVDGSEFALSDNGLVLKNDSANPIPTLYLPQFIELNIGQQIKDQHILASLLIIKTLQKSDFTPASIRILNGNIVVHSTQEASAIFSPIKGAGSQVDSLHAVIAKARIDAAKIEKIDLRFDKPIVTFKK